MIMIIFCLVLFLVVMAWVSAYIESSLRDDEIRKHNDMYLQQTSVYNKVGQNG